MPVTRQDIVLAGLAAAGQNASFTPVQIQKLFFLIDREIGALVDGPHFSFEPYDYGPFDHSVYREIEGLRAQNWTTVERGQYTREYALTDDGYREGTGRLQQMPAVAREYLVNAARWVRSLSFSQLVSAIYQHYPDMKAKSIFS